MAHLCRERDRTAEQCGPQICVGHLVPWETKAGVLNLNHISTRKQEHTRNGDGATQPTELGVHEPIETRLRRVVVYVSL